MVQDTDPVGSHGHHRGQGRRWHGLPGVIDAPCYFPTVEEFEEPLKFIASIRQEAERYGICRICPPSGWKPPFVHKPDKLRFATKEQDLGKLAGTQRLTRKFMENLRKFLFLIGKPMESAFGGKVCVGDRGLPVDMFRLFKEVRGTGGHSEATRKQGWGEIADSIGLSGSGKEVEQAYVRYLSDFEAAHSGRGLEGHRYTPVVYREKASVEADLRVGITLWHFLEEDHGAGRCYYGTVKSLRSSQCIVEYNRAERFPEPRRHDSGDQQQQHGGPGSRQRGGWSGNAQCEDGSWAVSCYASEGVQPFRVTLPRAQLSTLVLNGRSPAAAKLAAHGVICEVCSIAAASKAVLAVCASCDSAYHLACVEPALPRVPFNDWFCGDCAKDGSTAEGLARGAAGLFSVPSSLSSNGSKLNLNGGSRKASNSQSTAVAARGGEGEEGGVVDRVGSRSGGGGNGRGANSPLEGPKSERTEVGTKGGQSAVAAGGPAKKTRRASAPAAMETIATTRPRRNTKPRIAPDETYGSDVDAEDEDNRDRDEDGDEGSDSESDDEDEEAIAGQGAGKSRGGGQASGSSGARESDTGGDGEPASRMRGVSGMGGRALKYGFGNGGQFTLKEFALMADGWRSTYLARRGLGDEASEAQMEEEFWKLVGPDPPEDDVKVLYGSDLDTGAVGSGFPWSRGGTGTGGSMYDPVRRDHE